MAAIYENLLGFIGRLRLGIAGLRVSLRLEHQSLMVSAMERELSHANAQLRACLQRALKLRDERAKVTFLGVGEQHLVGVGAVVGYEVAIVTDARKRPGD